MHSGKFPYSEDILQWIWDKLLFNTQTLKTESGLPITIIHQGVLNTSDGPDFNNAKIALGGTLWHGSIELHLNSSGWKQHGHHNDEAYNQVVLHVVVENNPKPIVTKNGSVPEVLSLLPYLSDELAVFINQMNANAQLPCASNLNYISIRALEQQIEKAHQEYLEKKGNDFLRFYDPDLLPSEAWKNALILSLFDGFGITYNREPMQEMGKWFLKQGSTSFEELLEQAYNYAGLSKSENSLSWNYKGVFPANHPKKRISEAMQFSLLIQKTPSRLSSKKVRLNFGLLGLKKLVFLIL